MKTGKYYIGDLCYLLTDKYYEEIVCSFEHDNKETNIKGVDFWYHHTAHGDGCYEDQKERTYGVDAGIIGCVNLDTIPNDALDSEGFWKEGGNVIVFDKNFSCHYKNYEGKICIGHIEIITDPEEDEPEYCYCCGELLEEGGGCDNDDCQSMKVCHLTMTSHVSRSL